jgi:hypothetical protein
MVDHAKTAALGALGTIKQFIDSLNDANEKKNDALFDEILNDALEYPLSVEVRSGWEVVGSGFEAQEYMILICTGGPAVRITGQLSEHNEPISAVLERQDWGTPWVFTAPINDNETVILMDYANLFYYGD